MTHQNLSIFNFKLFVKYILIPFIFVSIIISGVLNYLFEKKIVLESSISGAYKINRIINSNNKNEIPFFGSSRAEGTFIPDSLVKEGFNYGISGTQDDVLLFFLNEECKKNKTTPIIVNFDLDGLNHNLGDISNYIYNSDYKPIKELLKKEYKSIFSVPFLKYYGSFETYFKYYLNNKSNITKFTNKGAAIVKNNLTPEKFKKLVLKRKMEASVFKNDFYLNSKFINLLKNNQNRKFIIVVTPYHYSYFHNFKNYEHSISYLESLNKLNNVKVLNFGQMPFHDSLFLNTSHLNLNGAIFFNRILKDSLKVEFRINL